MKTLTTPLYSILFGVILLPSVSCTQNESVGEPQAKVQPDLVKCKEPRPEVCTMDYTPVVGVDSDGEKSDYSNACNACSNGKVIGYYPVKQ